jgi:murein DD-endopeptidase MepM/ murein hydrolase activator NlpD
VRRGMDPFDEAGALAPGLLAFLIAATIGIFFFLQLGHANVLATESRTAADAAALAGAEYLRDRLGNVGVGSTVAALDRAGACAAADDYARRNGARVVTCELDPASLQRPQYAVLVTVEGLEGPVEGPSDSVTEERPRARSRAEVQLVVASPGASDPLGHAFGHRIVGAKPGLAPYEGSSERWRTADGWDDFVTGFFGGTPNISGPSAQGFSWPTCGPVTSEFGPRWGRMHHGIDIGIPTGTPIGAAKEGTVLFTRNNPAGYGLYVDVDHGDGITTRYAHLSGFAVGAGDQVERGELIGGSGNTGSSTGPHLHFEVRAGGAAFNPRHVLSGNPPPC